MDTSVEPCDDFYKYACGKWNKHLPMKPYEVHTNFLGEIGNHMIEDVHKILEEQSDNDTPSMTEAKKLYRSCMHKGALEENNEDIWDLLERMGGMPLLGSGRGGGWNEDNYNLEDLLAEARLPIFVKIQVQENLLKPSHYTLWVSKGEFGLPDESLYKKGLNDKIMEAYVKKLIGMAKLLGASEQEATTEIYNVLQLEMSLAKIVKNENNILKLEDAINKKGLLVAMVTTASLK